MPRQNLTSRKLRRRSISSTAPSRDGHFAYDPVLKSIIVSMDGKWVVHGEPADPFADLYGTTLGKMRMMLDPRDAVMSGANLVSIANRGGAGAAFNLTKTGAGTITRTGNLLNLPASGVYQQLASNADLFGTRVFFVVRSDKAAGSDGLLAGPDSIPTTENGRGTIWYQTTAQTIYVGRHDASATQAAVFPLAKTLAGALNLLEVEIAGGNVRMWQNGVFLGSQVRVWTQVRVARMLSGNGPNGLNGQAGIVCDVVTNGSAGMDPVMARVRQTLMSQYGI